MILQWTGEPRDAASIEGDSAASTERGPTPTLRGPAATTKRGAVGLLADNAEGTTASAAGDWVPPPPLGKPPPRYAAVAAASGRPADIAEGTAASGPVPVKDPAVAAEWAAFLDPVASAARAVERSPATAEDPAATAELLTCGCLGLLETADPLGGGYVAT